MNLAYRPLDFVVLRVPLLPFEVFDDLDDLDDDVDAAVAGGARHLDDEARTAIAVGSADFDRALDTAPDPRADAALHRYLTRMSSRPTPFGLFAGVALGQWGERTTLQLAVGHRPRRTRPDAGWLAAFTARLERDPAIRSQLTVVANTSARLRAGRVVLAERAATVPTVAESATVPIVAESATVPIVAESATVPIVAESATVPIVAPSAVSVRATGVVRRALEAARTPIRYADLVELLVTETPGADHARVESLLDELCRQTLLLTELRVSPTHLDRASVVRQRLSTIAPAARAAAQLESVLDAATVFDTDPPTAANYRAAARVVAAVVPFPGSPLQVDSGLRLAATTVAPSVAAEAARAAGLLLRVSPNPHGPGHLVGYRRAFEHRYGARGEVGVLELLDPIVGLGPPPAPTAGRLDPGRSAERGAALLALATSALHNRTICVELDDELLHRLETADQAAVSLPPSLELTVSIAAASRAAVDRGDFELVIGPNVGSGSAGRMLGRFAHLVPGASEALQRIADQEEASVPGVLFAELSYLPRKVRQINVATRPNAHRYEIAIDVAPATDPEHTIHVDELVVGVRDGRLRLRWAVTGQEVVVSARHMLNSAGASVLARFLSEIGRDGSCQLAGFSWGPAAGFPYLPRVRSGRVVLSLAQWRLAARDLGDPASVGNEQFREVVDRWRARWQAPARLAIAAGDRRLALDLNRPADLAELRSTLRTARGAVTLTELYPDAADLWLTDTDDRRFSAELVVPLIRRATDPDPPTRSSGLPGAADRRPPGSDWLFMKLYTATDLEDELLAGPVRAIVREAAALGVESSFFLRYDDPERHIRLRFHGTPDLLLATVLPSVTRWATDLMSAGLCRRFAIDTYERETDRFGGPAGTDAVEAYFAADSAAVLDLLEVRVAHDIALQSVPLAVLTVDALLSGFGLDLVARARWCEGRGGPRRESGADYRAFKAGLRPLLIGPTGSADPIGPAREALQQAAAGVRAELDRHAAAGMLMTAPTDLLSSLTHLHLNRLIAADRTTERRVYGLLGRLYSGLAAPRPRD